MPHCLRHAAHLANNHPKARSWRDVGADGRRFDWVIQVFTSVVKCRAPFLGAGKRAVWLAEALSPNHAPWSCSCRLSWPGAVSAASPYHIPHFGSRDCFVHTCTGAAAVGQGCVGCGGWLEGSVRQVIRQRDVAVKSPLTGLVFDVISDLEQEQPQ